MHGPSTQTGVQVLAARRCLTPRALAIEVDVDPVKLRLGAVAVVVQKAENFPVPLRHEKLRVAVRPAAGDALGQRRNRIRLLDDRSRERRADHVVVHCGESYAADGRDRRRVGDSGRSNE